MASWQRARAISVQNRRFIVAGKIDLQYISLITDIDSTAVGVITNSGEIIVD